MMEKETGVAQLKRKNWGMTNRKTKQKVKKKMKKIKKTGNLDGFIVLKIFSLFRVTSPFFVQRKNCLLKLHIHHNFLVHSNSFG